jgi:hypothetical protein
MITFNTSEEVKAYAKQQLEKTDYAVLPDVSLQNKFDFISYRNFIRVIYFNPMVSSCFPQEPLPVWGNPVSSIQTSPIQPKTNIPTE